MRDATTAIVLIGALSVSHSIAYRAGANAATINQIEADNEQADDIRDNVGSVSVQSDDVQFRD